MIHHTVNETTTTVGYATATAIADSVSKGGDRITTLELVYPRYIHAELLTHRLFSRNAASSRATPLKVTLEEVRTSPAFFEYLGKNKSGMTEGEPISEKNARAFYDDWCGLGIYVADWVERCSETYGLHKAVLNRALEPWLYIRTLVTATDWKNFFTLRLAPDAMPEMRSLAAAMSKAIGKSYPKLRLWHTPYADNETEKVSSVARCARVSYARLDGKPDDPEADKRLYERLINAGHWSPFEHVAKARVGRHGNYTGWESYRSILGGDAYG